VQLVVIVEAGAGVLELDLGVERDVVVDLIGRQQHEASHVEAVLPLTVGVGILLRAELDLAVRADLHARNRRGGDPEQVLVGAGRRSLEVEVGRLKEFRPGIRIGERRRKP
jgi:hypothetical protein